MRKKLVYLILVLLVGVLFFNACKKDEDIASSGSSANNAPVGYRGSDCYDGVEDSCGILVYSSMSHFQSVYECLEQEQENYINYFDSVYAAYSDSMFNVIVDSLNWDEDDPLMDFEAQASGYHSYRELLQSQEDYWLNNGGFDATDTAITQDDILATMMNSDRAWAIDTVLYWYGPDGTLYSITIWTCELYELLKGDPVKTIYS